MIFSNWFADRILTWYSSAKRPLPWRSTTDPYLIWLSEIILQQTRVDQGMAYYERFSTQYPSVQDLANATLDQVLKDWEGLGYYSRARNLHAAANHVVAELDGQFPKTYKELLQLKGVGPYTAAAIASIAGNEPVAVVDGNVFRVLSRVFGVATAIDSTAGKKEFTLLANKLLKTDEPGEFNQAMMEFGALQCTPRSPQCTECIFSDKCVALASSNIDALPVKQGKTKVRKRYFDFIRFEHNGETILEKRTNKDIWQGLYQFPLIESDQQMDMDHILNRVNEIYGEHLNMELLEGPTKHVLSHQHIIARLWLIKTTSRYKWSKNQVNVAHENIDNYALPRVLTRWLEK